MLETVITGSKNRYYYGRQKVTFYSDANGITWFDVEEINNPIGFIQNGLNATTNLNKSMLGSGVSTTIKDKPTLLINRKGIALLYIYYPDDKSIENFLDWIDRF